MKNVLLFSGGLDSYILYHFLKEKVDTLYFYTKNRYAWKEFSVVKQLIPSTLIDYSFNFRSWERSDAFIPFRNILFAIGASRYADTIYLGGVSDDRVNDNSLVAHADMTALISRYLDKFVEVEAPLAKNNWSKFDAVRWFLDKFPEKKERLLETISCYSEEELRCMECGACFRWWTVLSYLRVEGVPEYKNVAYAKTYVRKAEDGEIGGERGYVLKTFVKDWVEKRSKSR